MQGFSQYGIAFVILSSRTGSPEATIQLRQETQGEMVDLQWRLEEAPQAFSKLLEGTTVDETFTLQQWDQLLSIEQQINWLSHRNLGVTFVGHTYDALYLDSFINPG